VSFVHVVGPEHAGKRLDAVLALLEPALSRAQAQRLIDSGAVRVGGVAAKPAHKLRAGERIEGSVPEPVETAVAGEEIPLAILHEDADLVVVNKPAGMVVHPAPDELDDGGAAVFAETIRQIKRLIPTCTIEVLIPDFEGNEAALVLVCAEKPDILNHNIETVRRLFPAIRPQGKYQRSIDLLGQAKQRGMRTKSGLIVGMGETMGEVREVMQDLRSVGCDIMTIGQYLQPTKQHLPVARFYHPDEFAELKAEGLAMGFDDVESGPLVRSSYHAEQQIAQDAG
jgi:hypothetical protein